MKGKFGFKLSNSVFTFAQRVLFVSLLLIVATSDLKATSTYYSKMTVKVESGSTGKGKVYVSTEKNPASVTYGNEISATQSGSSKTQKYYLRAQANDGFYHVGWSASNTASALGNSNTNPYEGSITASSTEQANPTTGEYYAIFSPVSVTGVTPPDGNISVADYQDVGSKDVVFDVQNADSPSDFNYSVSGDGFSVSNAVYASNKVTLTIQYKDQNIHGTDIAETTVTLTSRGDASSTASTKVKANSNLTPTFTKPADYNFGQIYTGDAMASGSNLYVVNKNKAASQPTPASIGATGAIWTASITGADASAFVLTDSYPAQGECVVTFRPTQVKDYTATLNLTVSYTDSKGTTLTSATTSTTLTGSAIAPVKSAIEFNPTSCTFDPILTGDIAKKQVIVSQQNVSDVTYSFGSGLASDFPFSITSADGSVTITAQPVAPGTFNATLTATGSDTRDGHAGESTTGTLPVSITVGLQAPVLVGGSNLAGTHYLKWTKVPCATAYQVYEVNGSTKTSVSTSLVTEDATHITHSIVASADKIYEVEAISTYGGGNYTSRSNQWTVDHDAIAIGSTPYLDIWTGTEKNSTTFPYRPKEKVDLSSTFDAEGNALFDKLYIFGLTTPSGGGTELTLATYTYPGVAPNAVTPCYIYQKKNDGKGYTLESTIANMNVSDKPLSNFTSVNGKKLYFTGHCPYGSNGYGAGNVGVVYVKGNAGEKVDIYLHNLTLYGRMHTAGGYLPADYASYNETDKVTVKFNILGAAFGGDTQFLNASASAFVFASGSSDPNNPFSPTIHLMGDNELDGGTGWILADATAKQMEAGMYSSPIHLHVTDYNQVTTLSIDDKWPVDALGNTVRTNGKLDLSPHDPNRPSVELGNAYSTLNFNGGQIVLKNNLPVAQGTYVSTFAIAMRSMSYDVSIASATMVGMGADQPSGNVNFNDGSFYCTPIQQWEWDAYSCATYYHNKESLKCPVNTRMNGGTYYSEPYSCFDSETKGGSPTNKHDNELVSSQFKINNTPQGEYGIATVNFDSIANALVCQIAGHPDFGRTLAQYYQDKESYGRNSLKAANDNTVTFMIPYQFTEKEIVQEVQTTFWVVSMPVLGGRLGLIETTMGGDVQVQSSEFKRTANIVYYEGDQYAIAAAGPESGYVCPTDVALEPLSGIEMGFMDEYAYRANVINTESYVIDESQYIVKPIEAADKWMLFSPPFDITNVYVIESYNEDLLRQMAEDGDNTGAYIQQAKSAIDLLFFIGNFSVFKKATIPFWSMYSYWAGSGAFPAEERGRGAIKLAHFTGRNYDANYYLQRSSGTWTWDGTTFNTDWKYLPATPEQVDHGGTMYDVVMKKGEIYAMKFPYMYDGYMTDGGAWDYWTGKYLIFEGLGPQTIDGKNKHADIMEDMATPGVGVLRGNTTLATMEVEENNAYYAKDGNKKFTNSSDLQEIYPAEGFLLANPPSASPLQGRKASIDMMSGVVTYEGDESSSTPTIAGSCKLLVYTTNGGLILLPVVPQSVAIYNAAGVLVGNQYITEQAAVSLPAGAYFIRGEYDQVKAIVK